MLKLKGIPINPGIVEGPVFIKINPIQVLEKKPCNSMCANPSLEIDLYMKTLDLLLEEFKELKCHHSQLSNSTNQQMLDLYIAILNDVLFRKTIPENIKNQKIPAVYIILKELEILQKEFEKIDNQYFRSRFDDFQSIGHKILSQLMGISRNNNITKPKIIVADTISAMDIMNIPSKFILGIITTSGGPTSHAAILAESLDIPAIFGVKNFLEVVNRKDQIIMDGYNGEIIVHPDEETSLLFQDLSLKHKQYEQEVLAIASGNNTKDGQHFSLLANIGNTYDVPLIHKYKADGIGLLRTETLVLLEDCLLTEAEQTSYYDDILNGINNLPIYIRTLDLGGDKTINNSNITPLNESNPFLGFRSTRLFVQDSSEFKKQIRAILNSHHKNSNMHILIPFITTLEDFLTLKTVIHECYRELFYKDCPIPIGMMVEVPSALICIEDFLPHTDFISIGTNDLTQYILATDRNNPHVAHYHNPAHPAIIKILSYVAKQCKQHNVPLSLCGEMGKDPHFIRMLYGLGIDTLSMSPQGIPMARYLLTNSTLNECKQLVSQIKTMKHPKQIEQFLQKDLIEFLKQQEAYFDDAFIKQVKERISTP